MHNYLGGYMQVPIIQEFFDNVTATVCYVVYDKPNGSAIIIDSVLDYDPKSGRTSTKCADGVISYIKDHQLTVQWILETHAHADHLSAAPYLKEHLGGKIAIGEKITEVQTIFKDIFNLEKEFLPNGSQFDYLIKAGESLSFGDLTLETIAVPGHTPADLAYKISDAIFVGDSLFLPDVGTARCDFPGGSAKTLWQSIQKLLSYPPETKLFMCHDYPPAGRKPMFETTLGEQKRASIHVRDGITESEFIALRESRDKTLPMPVLLLPSVQVNIRAGKLPPKEDNGVTYLKIPINLL